MEKGVRLPLFHYSGKQICSISTWDGLVRNEIHRVKSLEDGRCRGWKVNERPKSVFWEEDNVDAMYGVGSVLGRALKTAGILLVRDFFILDDNDIPEMIADNGYLTIGRLKRLRNMAIDGAIPGACPHSTVDHRTASNPYMARYGDNWEERIKEAADLAKYCCVKDLVLFINEETKKIFSGTTFASNYFFYHDALTQMTDKKCVAWMEAQGIYKHWIKPELGCNNEIWGNRKNGKYVKSTRYAKRPVGNSPELNPLDNSCFRDTRVNLSLNVAATWHLEKGDSRKFSLATPQEITKSLEKLWHPSHGVCPSSARILEDIKRIPNSCLLIAKNGGKIVPGLCNRNSHRQPKKGGSRCEYKHHRSFEKIGIHHSIVGITKELYEKEKEAFFQNLDKKSALSEETVEFSRGV